MNNEMYNLIKQKKEELEKDYPDDYLRAIALTLVFNELGFTTKIKSKKDFLNRIHAFRDHNGNEFDDEKIISICEKLSDENEEYDFLRLYFDFISTDIKKVLEKSEV
jgi:hypothetical protein